MIFAVCHMLICSLCVINASTYNRMSDGLTEFPSSDIPSTTTFINVQLNSIQTFDYDAFASTNFDKLEILALSQNPFTELPNLRPVGTTLTAIHCTKCHFTTIDPDMFAALTVLEKMYLAGGKLTSFPNVVGPATTLGYLDFKNNQFTSTPCLDKYTALIPSKIVLDGNPITDSGGDPCIPVTNFSTNMSQLEELTFIKVPSDMTTVPLTCPRNDVTITFAGTPVSLCLCENVWIKAVDGQRGSVNMVDKTCDGATTTAEILEQQCQHGDLATQEMIVQQEQYFCAFPIAQYVTGVSRIECGVACLQTLGCSGYNFRETTGPRFGDCAIVAPTDSSITDIPDQDNPAWTYWTKKN